MHTKQIENVLKLSVEDRYDYFVGKIAEYEEIWGLYNEGWASLGNDDKIVLPFWPEAEFAKPCCTGNWESYEPKKISLSDFIDKWIPGMIKDNRLVNAFYIPGAMNSSVIFPEVLLEDLNNELEKFL